VTDVIVARATTPFDAPFWLKNRHVQTLTGALPLWSPPRSFDVGAAERWRIPLAGGGALLAHAHVHEAGGGSDGGPPPVKRTTAIVVHGVGGNSESRCVIRAAASLHREGLNVIRLNLRGAGESVEDAPSLYHAGLTDDLRAAIDAACADGRVSDVLVVGFSLGGSASLKLAGEWGDAFPDRVRGIAAISPPFDLVEVSRWLEKRRSFPYRRYVLQGLVAQGVEFARRHPDLARYDAAALPRLTSIRAYDDRVIAPMHGFASAEDYYRTQSSGGFLAKIRVPAVIVHALDDPMVPERTIRPWLARIPAHVDVALSQHGGHVGWFGGIAESHFVDTWAMRHVKAFLAKTGRTERRDPRIAGAPAPRAAAAQLSTDVADLTDRKEGAA